MKGILPTFSLWRSGKQFKGTSQYKGMGDFLADSLDVTVHLSTTVSTE